MREETGVEAELLEKLGDIRYWYSAGGERVLKVVSFFLFRYRSGSVRDHDHEVESARWLPLEEAVEQLAYRGSGRWPPPRCLDCRANVRLRRSCTS